MIIFSNKTFSDVCLFSGAALCIGIAASKFTAAAAGTLSISIVLAVLGLLGKCYQADVLGKIRIFYYSKKSNKTLLETTERVLNGSSPLETGLTASGALAARQAVSPQEQSQINIYLRSSTFQRSAGNQRNYDDPKLQGQASFLLGTPKPPQK
jgi:hypothetical protein